MSNFVKILSSVFLLAMLYCPAFASNFANPVLKSTGAGCESADNLRAERFAADLSEKERVKFCRAIEKITNKLNATAWSPALAAELDGVWQVFSTEAITLRSMPKGTSSRLTAMAQAFPDGGSANKFAASVFLRPKKSDDAAFFQILLHELRHVFDFYRTWKSKTSLNSIEIEQRGFLLMSKISEETPEKERLSGVPKIWKESWRAKPAAEIAAKREAAIDKYLRGSKFYRSYAQDAAKQSLDFSYLKTYAGANQFGGGSYGKRDGERLPNRLSLPEINAMLPQNLREATFNLEKPKNARDPKEILRVAVANEKKLYYGMSNFVYDQKLAFQCWQKGKVAASFLENNTVARTENGSALLKPTAAQPLANASRCTLDSRSLKTDFTETFWASPALDKMPVNFVGFVQVDGKTLARYTVLQPDAKLFEKLTAEYANIKPFRVFVGTIYVSPEDGQIVRFWGTSFPEEQVTGSNSQKVWGSYSVTALRQKLDIDGGLWVTVYVGTAAMANVGGNSRPFSYTVKFENYRQSTSDVKILDEVAADNGSDSSVGRAVEFK